MINSLLNDGLCLPHKRQLRNGDTSDLDYCEMFGDCYHCPVPFCPYQKLEDGTDAGLEPGEEKEDG